jgi:flagellar biosynthesis protein FlgN
MTQADQRRKDRLNQFAESLDNSLRLIKALEAIMLAETGAIQSRDPDELQRIVADKAELVVQLEAETNRQKQWLELAQQPFTPIGMAQFFAAVDEENQLLDRWSALRDVIARCDRLNESNASLIERDRKRVAMTLRLLKGDDGTPTTYDPRGRSEPMSPRSRTISRA